MVINLGRSNPRTAALTLELTLLHALHPDNYVAISEVCSCDDYISASTLRPGAISVTRVQRSISPCC
jgi:hypothetical protein